MNLYVNIYPKVVRDLNIIGNIPGIFLKKPGKIMEISWNFVSSEIWEPCAMDEFKVVARHVYLFHTGFYGVQIDVTTKKDDR